MLDTAPLTRPVAPLSAVDHIAIRLGHVFVGAIVDGDFDRLEAMCAADLRFRALIPREYVQASTASGAREVIEGWFGDTDRRELVSSTVEMVGDRLVLGYRLDLTEDGERRVVEQHAAAIVEGGVFRDVTLICSGFRLLAVGADSAAGTAGLDSTVRTAGPDASADDDHTPDAAFTPAARLDAIGLSCATLTPTISASVRALDVGTILEIVTDEPEAEESLRSWTRLTGNELVAVEAGPGSARRFAIRRSPRPAATVGTEGTN